ncbi:hypothetical protein E4T66_12535 [Sinimarinibacterium sp. CAU 1509]|uniref:M28 family peptidase n=1 Tax=Sinimarinibacterium sp. CAU 1509 TaxID=2562283 RepID=UPI0010AC1426|nr:M28 family peptidase [Sinimarinibacterium sp. CAU 1509]TJY60003.1 hypothetical protein E4T66_12535 [Sinimarinibacterium sp. CAU 1509]
MPTPFIKLGPLFASALICAGAAHAQHAIAEITTASPQLAPSEVVMDWIEQIEKQGHRRPGYSADEWTEHWLRDRFNEFGLQDVQLDPIDVVRWEPQQWSLQVWHENDADHVLELASWPVPLSANAEALEGELLLSQGPGPHTAGKIAVVGLELLSWPQRRIRDTVATWAYDPAGEFDTLTQVLPMSVRFQKIMDPEIAAGAIGFIGILDFPWETDRYYNPYDAQSRSIPGLYLSHTNGERLKAFMAEAPTRARISLQRKQTSATSHNVTGSLPGRSDDWVVIGSHHDGPWNSAVEDASGTALVLAQAYYWSQLPREMRPHNMLFLLNGGHMSGGAGLLHMADSRKDFLQQRVVTEIHLEHAAREARAADGKLVPTDKPEVRWWFTSFIPRLEQSVARAICKENLERSLIMPVEGFPSPESKHPPTDAAFFHPLTPIVSFLTAPMYLFDPADRLNMVHEDSLLPLTRAVIDIVNDLDDVSAAAIREGIYAPPRAQQMQGCAAS